MSTPLSALPFEVPFSAEQQQLLLAAVAVLLLFLIILTWRSSRRNSGGSVVAIVGPSNAGKTCLYFQLKDNTTHNGTVASIAENEGLCTVFSDKDKVVGQVKLVDVPGHPRLRHKLEQHLKDASAVIFVVDATDITPSKTDAAEELYEVLVNPGCAKRKIPVLLACNKTDLEAAYSVDFIKRTLEKQLDSMRKTKSSLTGDAPSSATTILGKLDKPFSLAQLKSPVAVTGISAIKGEISDVQKFLCNCLGK